MKLGPLNHVGFVTPSTQTSAAFYRDVMGATKISEPIYLEDAPIKICFVEAPNFMVELIEPLDDSSEIAAFLRAHPHGAQHHLCYEVPDIKAAWDWFESQGIEFACPIIKGVLGFPIFFIQTQDMGGSLIELMETPRMRAQALAGD